jgi:flagellar FliJ protein
LAESRVQAVKRSQRLKIVLQIAERNEAAMLTRMQEVKSQLQQEMQKQQEFENYRAEYQRKLAEAASSRISTAVYINYQRFIAQLGLVIEQQQQKIHMVRQHLEKATSQWRLAHEKTRGMSEHIQSCRDTEQREADAKEQRMLDEVSQTRNAFRQIE